MPSRNTASPSIPPDFTHFDYVIRKARNGGTLVLANPDRPTSFDKFNPFTLKGTRRPASDLMFESLTTGTAEKSRPRTACSPTTSQVAADGMSTTFHINPKARFIERRSGHRRRTSSIPSTR